jgi:hypothetical protein
LTAFELPPSSLGIHLLDRTASHPEDKGHAGMTNAVSRHEAND